jgi:hypothetical protein
MAGQRQPGSWGLEPTPVVIDEGTSSRIQTPLPGPTGVNDSWNISLEHGPAANVVSAGADVFESLSQAIAGFRRSESWATLQPIVFQVAGQYSFGLGVLYGVGENVVGSVVELGQLAKTLLLADLYDRARQPALAAAAFGPTAIFQRLMAEASRRAFGAALEEAHRERDELIAELRYAMTHLGEVVGSIADSYVAKWNQFEALSKQRTLSSQFEAGRIFGEVLLEVVSLIGGGAAAVKAASKAPRLARLARARIAPRSRPPVRSGAGAVAAEKPVLTPSQARAVEAPVAEPPPVKPPAPKSTAAALAGSEFNGVKSARIRPGSDTKVAVIGRNMEAVEKYAKGLEGHGYQPEVFAGNNISRSAQDQWVALQKRYAPNRIPDSVVRESVLFSENQVWARKLADQGYTVVDIGNPTQQGLSQFYEMEKGILFGMK